MASWEGNMYIRVRGTDITAVVTADVNTLQRTFWKALLKANTDCIV
jgi:hypothetical protein